MEIKHDKVRRKIKGAAYKKACKWKEEESVDMRALH